MRTSLHCTIGYDYTTAPTGSEKNEALSAQHSVSLLHKHRLLSIVNMGKRSQVAYFPRERGVGHSTMGGTRQL